MAITAAMVKELREKTNAGMMDCKKALTETDGNVDKAIDLLREKGLSQAAKKSGRVAAEGLTTFTISQDGKKGVVLEVNSETDFVSKNEEFKTFVIETAQIVLDKNVADLDTLKATKYLTSNITVQDELTNKIAKIGENMSIRRFNVEEVNGVVAGYSHAGGKISVIVALESEGERTALEELGKDIAMQVAAMNPKYISKDDVDQDYIAHEREILVQQALNEGKPQNIVEKMVEGRLQKELKEVCLLEQAFVKDADFTVLKYINNTAQKLGKEIKVVGIQRYEVGEGIEKKEESFAEEVAKQMGN